MIHFPRRACLPVLPLTACLLALLLAAHVAAQGSKQDYERAASYGERTRNRVFRSDVRPQWIGDGPAFWYRIAIGPQQAELVLVDPETGTRQPAFDHTALAAALAEATGKPIDPQQLPFRTITFNDGRSVVRFSAFGKSWRFSPESRVLTTDTTEDSAATEDAGVRKLESVSRSRRTGEETSLVIENHMDGPVRLVWIDTSGKQQSYGTIEQGRQHDQHTFDGHVWLVIDAQGRPLAAFEATAEPGHVVIDGSKISLKLERRKPPRDSVPNGVSPDGQWKAGIRDFNVVLQNQENGESIKLSDDGTEDDPYRPPFHWSPDSTRLVMLQERQGERRTIHIVESSPKDQLQPKLQTVEYAKPGDRISQPRPRMFDVTANRRMDVSEDLFPNPWSISDVHWSPDSSRFTFLYNQRGHQVLRIVAVAADSGSTRAVIEETSKTFIDYVHKRFTRYLDQTQEIIWMSERDGWNHLYLIDAETGAVKNAITQGPWVVREVERVDEERRQIWFRAGGIRPDQDPYYVHLARVNFDGSGLTVLTEGDGTHRWSFSPDRRYLLDTWSRVDQPPVTELRDSQHGRLVCELERADWSRLRDTGWQPPQRFVANGRDGKTDIYGIIVRPTNFDANCEYPVIEKIYAGPQGAFVPKTFGLQSDMFAMAELGFIVVQIDGMGTSYRSKAFHDVCWKNLGDSGFPDRIAWIRAAAAEHPEMDLTRVGIYGGSAGGQSALRALLAHGDFYHAGAADCGCHDNRMDKIWWNELWMGWPVGPHYEEQSNVTQAHRLQGKLLLTVGELDHNVDPASTMQVVDALIKADKDFDLVIVPGAGHGAGERPYGKRRRADFFVRHLLAVEPRWHAE